MFENKLTGCSWFITPWRCICWHLFRRSRHWRINDIWNESRRYTSWIKKVCFLFPSVHIPQKALCSLWHSFSAFRLVSLTFRSTKFSLHFVCFYRSSFNLFDPNSFSFLYSIYTVGDFFSSILFYFLFLCTIDGFVTMDATPLPLPMLWLCICDAIVAIFVVQTVHTTRSIEE